jgi:hypothetical protein
MDANDGEHFAPSGATVVECFRAINISLLRSNDSASNILLPSTAIADEVSLSL